MKKVSYNIPFFVVNHIRFYNRLQESRHQYVVLSEMASHRKSERQALESGLRAEGCSAELSRAVRFGVAYHHAGLSSDERVLLEHAFR